MVRRLLVSALPMELGAASACVTLRLGLERVDGGGQMTGNIPFRLDDSVAIVTGASRGLGQAIAVALASVGAHIVGVAAGSMHETVEAVRAQGSDFLAVQSDLAKLANFDDIILAAISWRGRLDVVVNNAGIIRRSDAMHYSTQSWDHSLQVNLRAVFLMSHAAARHWLRREAAGKIVNIAAMPGFQGGVRAPACTAAKSGVLLTRALANEWGPHRINVNGIAPGYMEIDNTEALRTDTLCNADILKRIPPQRWGVPEDLTGAAIYLASRASNYVNGHTLAVDGGWHAI